MDPYVTAPVLPSPTPIGRPTSFAALDQIKQHIDAQISVLSNDLKELKISMVNNKRPSVPFHPIITHDFAESIPAADRPSDKQFAHVARRLSRIVGGEATNESNPFILSQSTRQSLQLQSQATGASVMSEYSNRVVADLKTQFDEVQHLRRWVRCGSRPKLKMTGGAEEAERVRQKRNELALRAMYNAAAGANGAGNVNGEAASPTV